MKSYKLIFTVFLVLIYSMTSYAQNNTCPDNMSHPQNDSEELLADYLNSDRFESTQAIFNLPDLQNSQIELLSGNSDECYELNSDLISDDITDYLGSNEDYTYYKVSNYYFVVFWHSVNRIGTRNIFIYSDKFNFIHEALL